MVWGILLVVCSTKQSIGEILKNPNIIPFATSVPNEGAYLKAGVDLYFCKDGSCQTIEATFTKGSIGFQSGQIFASYLFMDPQGGFIEKPDEVTLWRNGKKFRTINADFPKEMVSVVSLANGLVTFDLGEDQLRVQKFSLSGEQIENTSIEAPMVNDRYTRGRVRTFIKDSKIFAWVPRSNALIELDQKLNVLRYDQLQFPETLNKVPKRLFGQFITAVDGDDSQKRDRFIQTHTGQIFRHEPYGVMLDREGRPITFYQVLIVEPDRPHLKFMSINTLLITHDGPAILREKLIRHFTVYGFTGDKVAFQRENRTFELRDELP